MVMDWTLRESDTRYRSSSISICRTWTAITFSFTSSPHTAPKMPPKNKGKKAKKGGDDDYWYAQPDLSN